MFVSKHNKYHDNHNTEVLQNRKGRINNEKEAQTGFIPFNAPLIPNECSCGGFSKQQLFCQSSSTAELSMSMMLR